MKISVFLTSLSIIFVASTNASQIFIKTIFKPTQVQSTLNAMINQQPLSELGYTIACQAILPAIEQQLANPNIKIKELLKTQTVMTSALQVRPTTAVSATGINYYLQIQKLKQAVDDRIEKLTTIKLPQAHLLLEKVIAPLLVIPLALCCLYVSAQVAQNFL